MPVAVCGGGPVGLTLALELAAWEVPVALIEKHRSVSPFPKGRALSTRSMEIYRQLGLEAELTEQGLDRADVLHFYSGETLTADDHVRISTTPPQGGSPLSPTYTLACSQDRLEATLRRHVSDHPLIDARFGWTVADAHIDHDHASLEVRDADGSEHRLRCRWVVAADGAESRLRQIAGIGKTTFGAPCENVNIMFEADLEPIVEDRRSLVYTLSNDNLHASVLAVDGRRWLCNVISPDRSPTDAAEDPDWCRDRIREAIGRPVDLTVLGAMAWTATASNATTYRKASLLLAGDAAHVATPYGGFGMNCGIADAHNLAWKLAGSVADPSRSDLVDTYDAERRPIGERTVAESAVRLGLALDGHRSGRTRRGEVGPNPSDGIVLGGCYRSAAILAGGPPPPQPVATYDPAPTVGARAPHAWLAEGRSTLDLFGVHHTLLHHPETEPDLPRAVISLLRPEPLATAPLVEAEPRSAYGIDDGGAVLVRPDGHISWHSEHQQAR